VQLDNRGLTEAVNDVSLTVRGGEVVGDSQAVDGKRPARAVQAGRGGRGARGRATYGSLGKDVTGEASPPGPRRPGVAHIAEDRQVRVSSSTSNARPRTSRLPGRYLHPPISNHGVHVASGRHERTGAGSSLKGVPDVRRR
jgi:ABC-type uncharacterized transport system ATPase subunit